MSNRVSAVIFVCVMLGMAGCRYSFSGGSVPGNLKSVYIPIVQDQSGFGDPALRDKLTQELVLRFTNDGSLTMADRDNSESVLETVITSVRESATVVKPGEEVSQRRMTITAHVIFTDLKTRKKVWERDFSQWGDFPSGASLTQRDEGIQEAIRKLTEDILNETVAGW